MGSMGPKREQFGYRPVNSNMLPEQKPWNQQFQLQAHLPQSPRQPMFQSQSPPLSHSQSQPLPQLRHSTSSIHGANQNWHGQSYSMTSQNPRYYNPGPTGGNLQQQQSQQQQVHPYPSYISINWQHPSQNQFHSQSHPNWNNLPSQQQPSSTQSNYNLNSWNNRYPSNQPYYGFGQNRFYVNPPNMPFAYNPNYAVGPPNGYPNANMMNQAGAGGNWWNRLNAVNNNYTNSWGNTPPQNAWGANVALSPDDNTWQGSNNDANNANFSTSGQENGDAQSTSRTTLRPSASRTSPTRGINRTPVSNTSTPSP